MLKHNPPAARGRIISISSYSHTLSAAHMTPGSFCRIPPAASSSTSTPSRLRGGIERGDAAAAALPGRRPDPLPDPEPPPPPPLLSRPGLLLLRPHAREPPLRRPSAPALAAPPSGEGCDGDEPLPAPPLSPPPPPPRDGVEVRGWLLVPPPPPAELFEPGRQSSGYT